MAALLFSKIVSITAHPKLALSCEKPFNYCCFDFKVPAETQNPFLGFSRMVQIPVVLGSAAKIRKSHKLGLHIF